MEASAQQQIAANVDMATQQTKPVIKKKKRVMPKLQLEESHHQPDEDQLSTSTQLINNQDIDTQSNSSGSTNQSNHSGNGPQGMSVADGLQGSGQKLKIIKGIKRPNYQGTQQSMTSVGTIPISANQINIEQEMSKIAPMVSDSFYVSDKFQDEFKKKDKIKSSIQGQSISETKSVKSSSSAHSQNSTNSNSSQTQIQSSTGNNLPSNVESLDLQMTVMHIDSSKAKKQQQTQNLIEQQQQPKKSQEEELKEAEEEIKNQLESGGSSENPVLKGNKKLGVEVKLTDLIRYGGLGQGASGFVEKAVHKPTKKIIALKVIPLQSNEKVKKQILLELRTLHECDCDNIVRSYGSFLKDGYVHIALEFMDAGTITDIIKEVGSIPEQILGMMTVQILRGLEYLHKTMKVTHRDIKPSNILINKKGMVKIADFGVSGQMDNTLDCMSSWVGTVTFMSPERLKGESYFSDTDIWSLGLVLVECALGRYPFPYPDDPVQELGFWEIVKYVTEREPPKLPPTYSDDIKDFISICLRKQGGTRLSATELLKHPFITKYEKVDPKHLKRWIRTIN